MDPIPLTSETKFGSEHMRPLVMDEAIRQRIAAVRAYADQPEHYYRPPLVGRELAPGDIPAHCLEWNTYRVVYSITVDPTEEANKYRHLSVSVPSGKYPHIVCMLEIATAYGFTGWDGKTMDKPPEGWLVHVSKAPPCVVVAQALPPDGGV